jgi:hypothetical protein
VSRALVLVAMLVLAGCERQEVVEAREASNPFVILTDQETGCQYLVVRSSGSAPTPRIAADGKTHMGCRQGGGQ